MKYRPDIDGLRAIAVLSVLFYHAHLGFPGGYVGVDVFFVISGYLISSILLKRIKNNTFSYIEFWKRRIRRLVPALFVLTVFVALIAPLILLPRDLKDLGAALISQPLLLANVYYWRAVKGGYFGDPPETRPLLHTWSLGVEEQFYLFFPILLVLVVRRSLNPKNSQIPLLTLGVLSFTLSVWLTEPKPVFSFFTLPTRTWEFLLGTFLAVRPITLKSRVYRESLSVLGLLSLLYSFFFFSKATLFPGWTALLPCLGTTLLIWSNSDGETWSKKLLSLPPLVKTGQLSYSLYLWHWPIIAFYEYVFLDSNPKTAATLSILSYLAGYASWRWVERPTRHGKWLESNKALLRLTAGYALFCVLFGTAFLSSNGLESLWDDSVRTLHPTPSSRTHIIETRLRDNPPQLGVLGSTSKSQYDFLIWGDSHAMALAAAYSALGKELGLTGIQITRSAEAPMVDWTSKTSFNSSPSPKDQRAIQLFVLETVEKHNLRQVHLVARWSSYEFADLEASLQDFAEKLKNLGCSLVLVCDVPEQEARICRALALQTRYASLEVQPTRREDYLASNSDYNRVFEKLENSEVFQPQEQILTWNTFQKNDKPLYFDGDHLTDQGALELTDSLRPFLQRLQKAPLQP